MTARHRQVRTAESSVAGRYCGIAVAIDDPVQPLLVADASPAGQCLAQGSEVWMYDLADGLLVNVSTAAEP